MIKSLLAVALGGVLGTLLRYGAGLLLVVRYPKYFFLATLLVNLLGCFAIGYLHGFFLGRPTLAPEWRVGLMTGLLGGFTTFSSFSLDTLRLLEEGQWLMGLGYLLCTVMGGLLAAWMGLMLGR